MILFVAVIVSIHTARCFSVIAAVAGVMTLYSTRSCRMIPAVAVVLAAELTLDGMNLKLVFVRDLA